VAAGGRLAWHPAEQPELGVLGAVGGATVVIDGLLGIGARGAPRPPLDNIIATLNRARVEAKNFDVVAVDVPSGLDADTGIAERAVQADATVILGAVKRGLLAPSALLFLGEPVLADIGVIEGPESAPQALTASSVRRLLPRPLPGAHKGSYGRLLVVGGSAKYPGAPSLVCGAAVRSGTGIVTLAASPSVRDVVASRVGEATFLPLSDGGLVDDPEESARRVIDQMAGFAALAIGPGLSTDGGAVAAVETILRARARLGLPAVIDADALNALAQRPGWTEWLGPNVVLTPHPGELRRLAEVAADEPPWDLAGRLAVAWGVTLVVKGAITAIGAGAEMWVHARPNPALGTGGTGDVLTGITGALLARGLAPPAAARLAVWAHGEAGAAAATGKLAGGLAASDLLTEVPRALAKTL
jgi:NAD(P)H-hydrate epimerase